MNQTTNWLLREMSLLKQQIEESKQLLACEEREVAWLRSQQQRAQLDWSGGVEQLAVLLQQASQLQALRWHYGRLLEAQCQRHLHQQQALQQQLQQERVRQN